MSAPPVLQLESGIPSAETPKDLSRWHSKRKVLHDLYICEKKPLKDVISIMERDHGFPKTLKRSDYEHVLREFNCRKNISANDWRFSIGPQIASRTAEGKRSEVLISGSKVHDFNRRIRRSLASSRAHQRAKANTAALPSGVVIRTPSPQPSTLTASNTFGRNHWANDIEQQERHQSAMEYLADSPSAAESNWLRLLTGVMPVSDAGFGATVLSAQLLREGCPINKLLTILDEYQRGFNPTDLRLFGPSATIGILGKMCFDFSNGLQDTTISNNEMKSILDWIGFSVDIASLKSFFAQKALTTLSVWEALNSTVRHRIHLAAFNVLLSVHLSIMDQAPWTADGRYNFSECVQWAPTRAATLLNAYPCDQCELDQALQDAVTNWAPTHKAPIELVKHLIRAGASLKSKDRRTSLDNLICYFARRGCEEDDLAVLRLLLEAGAVVDEVALGDYLGWGNPDHGPTLATDYLLLSRERSTHIHDLWKVVSQYSDRQQTTVTVPGIFEAAQGGQKQLHAYLNSRLEPSCDQVKQQVLEVALSEASGRGYVNVVRSLVQFGVDPNVRMLPPVERSAWIMGTASRRSTQRIWHPVIRALNAEELDTARILVAVSSIDLAFLDERVGEQLNLYALRNMVKSQPHQILQVVSSLNLSTASRSEILLRAVEPRGCQLLSHDGPDFGFVSQLLEFGVACLDHPEHLDGETGHILVRAIKRECGIRALSYLIERDAKILSALSATAIEALLGATLECRGECQEILELLAQNVEGFESYIREHSSSLLLYFLKKRSCPLNFAHDNMGHWQEDCEAMVTVKWFLDLGAPSTGPTLANLVGHANDSFMLAIIRNVADVDAVNSCDALKWSIFLGRLNLAVALIERGAQVNGPQVRTDGRTATTLQLACESGAPLSFIEFLVDKEADVNAPPAPIGGSTALQAACDAGAQLSCIHFLIGKGANVNAPPPSEDGFTALQYAARRGLMNIAGLLLDYGADVNALSGFYLPPYLCPRFRFMRAIDLAACYSRLDMVHFLIAAGARSCQPGRTGFEGAIEIATRRRNFAVARLLQEHADSLSGDAMEAEGEWLQANPRACMYNGRIQDAGWVAFMKKTGRESKDDFDKYIEECGYVYG